MSQVFQSAFKTLARLTERIVSSMSLSVSPADQRRLRPDVPRTPRAYEVYLRANQIAYQSDQWIAARDLYLECVKDDPNFAPAWAQLGRIYRAIGAYRLDDPAAAYDKAQEAFTRSLEINPDLALAHNLYTNLEVELGQADSAMVRLLDRARHRGGDPQLFAGLVQACRSCGLLDASVAAYEEARRLDPGMRTSVAHAYLMRGEYPRALQTCVERPPLINILALQLLGREDEALKLARMLEQGPFSRVYRLFAGIPRAWLEGQHDEAYRLADQLLAQWAPRDPCGRYYLARFLATVKHPAALPTLRQTVESGFVPHPFLLTDPALADLRTTDEFRAIGAQAQARYEQALGRFEAADGPRLVGLSGHAA
ncbi:MAG: tetratricopeptide repeat protein [Acidobacteriota bacterium]